MERLQEPINPCLFGDHFEVECLEQGFVNSELLSLEDQMPFLEMLQSVESPQLFTFKEPNFQTLLRLQHLKNNNDPFQIQALDQLDSCVTREILDLHSSDKSESNDLKTKNPHFSSSCFEGFSSESNQDQPKSCFTKTKPPTTTTTTRERRKRKRNKLAKNKEEVESQRMTHIAVERNRRRQMNDYLNSLRSLMPPSYIQRGDQASIIGGAIDFVKELEQLLQSMEAQKRMRSNIEESSNISTDNSVLKSAMEISEEEVIKAESKEGGSNIEVNIIQNHVNLKIQCGRRPGQLLHSIVTLESLRLTVLHLNITSSQVSVLYSFNLKMEDDCKIRSADEISATVHQIFS